jgi:hypothetical protein
MKSDQMKSDVTAFARRLLKSVMRMHVYRTAPSERLQALASVEVGLHADLREEWSELRERGATEEDLTNFLWGALPLAVADVGLMFARAGIDVKSELDRFSDDFAASECRP